MEKQERKFTLAQVHTKMGTMGEVTFDQTLMAVLGVQPEDVVIFTVSKEGEVTVTGEKKAAERMPLILAAPPTEGTRITPLEITQPELFDTHVTTIFHNAPVTRQDAQESPFSS